ncbi:MAG: GxxExxY protein [Aquificaceae bacterium]|nr:GxxExxY protein [Aquificaceae bacterium]
MLENLIRDIAEEVYRNLGSGFEEHIYQSAFAYELRLRGIRFQREVHIEIFYKGIPLGMDRPDFIIRTCRIQELEIREPVIVELKTAEKLSDNHRAQVRAYLLSIKHSSDESLRMCSQGFLVNFPKKDGRSPEVELITLSI